MLVTLDNVNEAVYPTREDVSINMLVIAPDEYLVEVLLVEYAAVHCEHLKARREFAALVGNGRSGREYNLQALVSHE